MKYFIERSEQRTRKNHYTITVSPNVRCADFVLTVKKGDNVDWETVDNSIEDIKAELENRVNEGYLKSQMYLEYKF